LFQFNFYFSQKLGKQSSVHLMDNEKKEKSNTLFISKNYFRFLKLSIRIGRLKVFLFVFITIDEE